MAESIQPEDQRFTPVQGQAMRDALEDPQPSRGKMAWDTSSELPLGEGDPNAQYEPQGPAKDIAPSLESDDKSVDAA